MDRTLTHKEHSQRQKLVEELEALKKKTVREFYAERCNVVACNFDERPFMMALDVMTPVQGCPNHISCTSCNACGYYLGCDKELGVVYCMRPGIWNNGKRPYKRRKTTNGNGH